MLRTAHGQIADREAEGFMLDDEAIGRNVVPTRDWLVARVMSNVGLMFGFQSWFQRGKFS